MRLQHLLICGLGSIGRRHLRHFRALGVNRIDAYRTGKATLPDKDQLAPDNTYDTLEAALEAGPQAVVVANPTSLHLETALAAVRAGAHLLVEKPLSHTTIGLETLEQEAAAKNVRIFVGYNMRFHPALQEVHKIVQTAVPLGKPLMMRIHFGAFLPDWHPWENFRDSYAAVKSLGGGVTLTSSHELDYAIWTMGPAEHAVGLASNLQPLGTDVDELSAIVMRHNNGALSAITLSFAQKPASRGIELAFERGTLSLDLLKGLWRIHEAVGTVTEHHIPDDYQIDETYRKQAEAFLRSLDGHVEELATLAEARESLKVAEIIMETT